MASTIGLVHLLAKREALKSGEGSQAEMDLLRVELRIDRGLFVAMADASSASARVRCERSRAEELADSIGRSKDRRKERKTVGGILAGAVTNVLNGVFEILVLSTTGGVAGIAGGVTQYFIKGLRVDETVTVEFYHRDNYLKDVWEGPGESQLFPPSVWRFLNHTKETAKSGRHSGAVAQRA